MNAGSPDQKDAVRVEIKVIPNASKERVTEEEGRLKVYVNASPEKGKANTRVLELIADRYGVKRNAVKMIRGKLSRNKLLEVSDAG